MAQHVPELAHAALRQLQEYRKRQPAVPAGVDGASFYATKAQIYATLSYPTHLVRKSVHLALLKERGFFPAIRFIGDPALCCGSHYPHREDVRCCAALYSDRVREYFNSGFCFGVFSLVMWAVGLKKMLSAGERWSFYGVLPLPFFSGGVCLQTLQALLLTVMVYWFSTLFFFTWGPLILPGSFWPHAADVVNPKLPPLRNASL
jgi:hypothetical protein